MTETHDPALFRPNVGLALFHGDGSVFLGKRLKAPPPFEWQMPQGGIDDGESPLDAAYRELHEEVGIVAARVRLLEETSDWLSYVLPDNVREAMKHKGPYIGQRQKWFAFRFLGDESDIDLDAHDREFSDWRWAPLASAPALVIPFKRATYDEIARRFARHAVGDH